MNRLKKEKSPYLLQHASNPVDWYPWGTEAFAQAEKEDKPIFLSIGYSTCHWCHVMAHESFEDAEVAQLLNREFISIKVDREERPDIDAVYMAACQALTGAGGWPLTILMTADQKPFWTGTYLPKKSVYGRPGLMELLDSVRQQWRLNREKMISAGEEITAFLQASGSNSQMPPVNPDKALIYHAVQDLKDTFDERWGGFGNEPKFPIPHNIIFLLQYASYEKDSDALHIAEHTLRQMYRGGIFDHLGGGFSRYSTDKRWLVPHFEKMLYDNALLVSAYTEAFHITQDPFYAAVAKQTLRYVLRELTDSQGGFYCGQDADSDGIEGKYYLFTRQEIDAVLGKQKGSLISNWLGVTQQGNFEGKNILNLLNNPDYEKMPEDIESLCQKLYDYRLERTRLHKDDKILTSWNSLMIAAMAKAGWMLNEPACLQAAVRAQQFIKNALIGKNGRLMLRWRQGEAAHDGQLDDYAFYAYALLALYRATLQADYLQEAAEIAAQMWDLFWDENSGGFFLYSREGEQLISRPKETYDGALPSGNSVAAAVLEELSKLTGEVKWQDRSYRQICFLTGESRGYPSGHSMGLIAVAKALYPSRELICATAEKRAPEELTFFLCENSHPDLTVLLINKENMDKLIQAAPFIRDYPVPDDKTVYYLCKNGACNSPVDNLEALKEQFKSE
ncbi:thioredoxin domain-containing protein [Novisyntrophococcus fermenticellae]|uniref:thioredoxin domain-containing protein n=1 Tax=Novisyntrophococcus fermenticellae TaxID=2068655 RepID=UPI001E433C82|nr:thioredoxin domain-containing protein [Novisyntrophococcus fermenticellae]